MAGRYPKQNWQSGTIISPYGPLGGARLQHIEDWLATIFDNHDAVVPLSPVAGGLFFNASTGFWENRRLKDVDVDPAAGIQASKIVGLPASELPGVMKMYGGAVAPSGYALCQGQAKKRSGVDPDGTDYSALFAVIGTNYGVGDGSTTFNLPDFQGRVPVGLAGVGGHADVTTLGNNDGSALANRRPKHSHTQALTLPNHVHSHSLTLPDHTHNYTAPNGVIASSAGANVNAGQQTNASAGINSTPAINGSIGNPTSNPTITGTIGVGTLTDTPAYIVVNVIIKL